MERNKSRQRSMEAWKSMEGSVAVLYTSVFTVS